MKLLFFLTMFCLLSCTDNKESPRQQLNINREWKFRLGDLEQDQLNLIDYSTWEDASLPHSFSIPYFLDNNVYQGYGWYYKEIEIPEEWMNKNISLEFEGAFIETELFVNSIEVGKHVGGYTGFNFDISKYIKPGKNKIAIRINNLWKPDVAPRAGDHQFSGGIYRDVYLNISDKLHIDWQGVFIQTPSVSKSEATCLALIEVKNNYQDNKEFTLVTQVLSPQGELLSTTKTATTLDAHQQIKINQVLPNINRPQLWSPDSPNLYTSKSSIYIGDEEIDRYDVSFGIRKFEWTADKGFFLNDKPFYIKGVNVHQDQAGWGDAVTNAAIYRDVQLIKDAGFNAIRGSHYPHDPAFSKACDEIGLLLFQESVLWGMGGSSGDRGWGTPPSSCYPTDPTDQNKFNLSVLSQLKEMIDSHKNHASIAAWSMCNEPFFTDSSTDSAMRDLLNQLTDSARAWDPTREVAIGGSQRKGIDRLGNGAIAFYNGDGASRTEFQDPKVPNLVSEYGSTTTYRPGEFAPGWGDILSAPEPNNDPFNPPAWRSGQIIWCGFDHGTVGGVGLATMGLIDYFRLPKRAYYWYQDAYKNNNPNPQEPIWPTKGIPSKVKLEATNYEFQNTNGTDDAQLILTILDKDGNHISNNVPVTLKIISGPGEFPTGRSIEFAPPSDSEASDISIRDGQAAISFRSYHAGTTVIEASSDGLTSSKIQIKTNGAPQWQEGITQPVKDRPYRRYVKETSKPNSATELLLAQNRPSWVSSSSKDSNKAFANDGDETTVWTPAKDDKQRWWKLGLEATYSIDKIQVVLPDDKPYKFSIAVSKDDKNWKTVVDSQTESKERIRLFSGEFGKEIAFIKIIFNSDEAALAEIYVGGVNEN